MSDKTFETDGLIYREATFEDLSRIMAFADIFLRKDVLLYRDYVAAYLKSGIDKVWLTFDREKLIAFAFIWKNTDSLNNLYVHPKYRKRKIGLHLIEYLKPIIVRSKTDQSTGDPTEFYRKIGYQIVATRQGRKKNLTILHRVIENESESKKHPMENYSPSTNAEEMQGNRNHRVGPRVL